MRYLLDTNICIYIIKKKPPEVFRRVRALKPGSLGISVVTVFELKYGALNSSQPQKNLSLVENFCLPLEILEWSDDEALEAARLRVELKHNPIGPMDLIIGSQARYHGFTLVTNNISGFRRIKGLNLENWALARV